MYNSLPLDLFLLKSLYLTQTIVFQIQFKMLQLTSLQVSAAPQMLLLLSLQKKIYKDDSRHPTGRSISRICHLPFLEYLHTVNPSWKMPVTSHGRDSPFCQKCWFCWKELHGWTASVSNTCGICYTCREN